MRSYEYINTDVIVYEHFAVMFVKNCSYHSRVLLDGLGGGCMPCWSKLVKVYPWESNPGPGGGGGPRLGSPC